MLYVHLTTKEVLQNQMLQRQRLMLQMNLTIIVQTGEPHLTIICMHRRQTGRQFLLYLLYMAQEIR